LDWVVLINATWKDRTSFVKVKPKEEWHAQSVLCCAIIDPMDIGLEPVVGHSHQDIAIVHYEYIRNW
jgi:hypothetical protein